MSSPCEQAFPTGSPSRDRAEACGPRGRVRPSWWAPLVQWRNWRLPVKLGAVLMVLALLAVGLGMAQIQGYVARTDSYADTQRGSKMRDRAADPAGSPADGAHDVRSNG